MQEHACGTEQEGDRQGALYVAWWLGGEPWMPCANHCFTDPAPVAVAQAVPPPALHPAPPLQVGTRGPSSPVLRFNLDAHLQGAAALHAPLSYKQHMDLISLILGCRRVIMFLCASRLPSFAPGHRPSHGSRSQVTAGIHYSVYLVHYSASALYIALSSLSLC